MRGLFSSMVCRLRRSKCCAASGQSPYRGGVTWPLEIVGADRLPEFWNKKVLCMFGIFGKKFKKPMLICWGIDGFEYIADLKLEFDSEPMKNDDMVDDDVGVEATGRLLLGENVPAKGFVIWADAGSVHPKKQAAPKTITKLRTFHLPRFETLSPIKEAGG
jgi:hypothetical protein